MGHDIHDTISEHGQKFSPNSNCELVDIKKDEQLVQPCELRCGSRRQVNGSDNGYYEERVLTFPVAVRRLSVKKTSYKFIIKRRRSGLWGVGTERVKGRNWEKKGEKTATRM